MSFLTSTKIVSKKLKLTDYRQYGFELFLLLFLGSAYLGISDLDPLAQGEAIATVSKSAFALIGALGLYGIRISSLIAMARHYRMPQVPEWLAFLIPMTLTIVCFIFSGTMVKTYATAHHYRFCYRQHDRATTYTFAKNQTPCPPLPTNAFPF